jgi:hypothetical protein
MLGYDASGLQMGCNFVASSVDVVEKVGLFFDGRLFFVRRLRFAS